MLRLLITYLPTYLYFASFSDESGPAAMQHGNSAKKLSSSLLIIFVIVIVGMVYY